MTLRALFAYSDNCRRVLKETLAANPEAFDRLFEQPLVEFKTIREVLAHTIGAEERWIVMRIGGRVVPWYGERAPDSLEELFADWERNRANTYRFMDSLSDPDYNRIHKVKLANGWEGELSVEQILFHVLNHETHHRAQVSMALQQMGIDPPDFDFVFLHV